MGDRKMGKKRGMKEKVEEGENTEYFKMDFQCNLPLYINHACLHAWQEYASQLCLWLVIFTKTRLGLIYHSVYPDPPTCDSHN